jgi:hypothetical protein
MLLCFFIDNYLKYCYNSIKKKEKGGIIMEIGTLVYLKNREILCKYIVYRPDKNVYVLEISSDVYWNQDRYIDVPKKEFEENAVVEKNIYTHLMKEKIKEYNKMIEELELGKVDNSTINEKINQLKAELENLQKIEEKTENQLKTIKNLEKAIRRQNGRINSNSRKFDEDVRHKVWELERKIENLSEALKYLKTK